MISIIIVNYNVFNYLKKCLKSLDTYKPSIPYEIILIDNNSYLDKIPLNDIKDRNIRVYNYGSNLGFSKAVNIGIKKSKGDYVLLMNPDSYLVDNSIDKMIDYMKKNDKIGIIGPKVLYPSGKYQLSSKRHFPTIGIMFNKLLKLDKIFYSHNYFGKYNYSFQSNDEIMHVDSVSGAFLIFKKELVNEIGPLDERFYLYFEDTDFCYRAIQKKYKVIYFPESTIFHHKSKSFSNSNVNKNYEFYKSLYSFYIKYYYEYKNLTIIKLFVLCVLRLIIITMYYFKKIK